LQHDVLDESFMQEFEDNFRREASFTCFFKDNVITASCMSLLHLLIGIAARRAE